MTDGKWITGLTPGMPPEVAAGQVLGTRLGVVRHYLPLAVERAHEDDEYVHQLRVSTRRAGAALDLFAECVPEKLYRAGRKVLKRIRRAAGAARDADVFRLALAEWARDQSPEAMPAVDFLAGHAHGVRGEAQKQLEYVGREQMIRLEGLTEELTRSVRPPKVGDVLRTLSDLAHVRLALRMRELDEAIADTAAHPNDYDKLHQCRIAGKRLRYAMEVFAECFTPAFRKELYPAVEEMQEILGAANDSHVAQQRMTALRAELEPRHADEWERLRPGAEALLQYHRKRLPEERDKFRAWVPRWQKLVMQHPLSHLRIAVEPTIPPG